jgi:hypothetical protein
MSARSIRKRVELLEQILRPQLDAANLAERPTTQPSDPIESLKLMVQHSKPVVIDESGGGPGVRPRKSADEKTRK